ncbi:MAG: hypothetical protein ACR2PA_00780 [Hyphomicrobiaceae bacterium]
MQILSSFTFEFDDAPDPRAFVLLSCATWIGTLVFGALVWTAAIMEMSDWISGETCTVAPAELRLQPPASRWRK